MTIRGDKILVFGFAVIDLARLDAREYASKLNAAAMALSTRMQMDPADRVGFTVDLIRNTVSAGWQQSELDTVLRFFLAYQQFTPKEDLKLQRELTKIAKGSFAWQHSLSRWRRMRSTTTFMYP
jgi:hypothetical protein